MSRGIGLTPWFSGPKRPVRRGVYQVFRGDTDAQVFQHWNGKFWGYFTTDAEQAARQADSKSETQCPTWRGLTK